MRSLRFFLSRWQNWLGLFIVLVFAVMALSAPLLSPPNKTTQGVFKKVGRQTDKKPHPPSETSPLGTLPGQLDVYHALVWGAREAMQFGLLVALGAFVFGSLFGAIAGYSGGLVNGLMMRIADAFLTFPVLAGVVFLQQLVAMTIESLGGIYWFNNDYVGQVVDFQVTPPPFAVFLMKVDPILICLILFSWMPIARLVNTMVITIKNTEFIQAARALGGNPLWIIGRHVLPNSIGPAIVMAARDVGSAVILQATITFVGLGGKSAWGTMLSMGRNWVIGPGGDLFASWWVFLPATLAIILFGVGWNLIGDGLTEAFTPSVITYEKSFFFKSKQNKDKTGVPALIISPTTHPELKSIAISTQPSISSASSKNPAGRLAEKSPLLQVARDAIADQNINQAIHTYSHLLEHHRHIQEIRHDLVQLARQFPHHAIIWTLLGDALTQEGNHEYAEKAYEQARNLTQ